MRHDARGSAVCAAVRQARSVLKGKRVLVTGGAGFVGSHIVDLLVAAGAGEVVVVDDMVRGRPGNLARVLGRRNVRLIEGDSGIRLPEMLADIRRPVLFWLDGHYSAGVTASAALHTPISAELQAILRHPVKGHVILIDDARCFDGSNDYPHIDDLLRVVREDGNYAAEVSIDIIRLIPRTAPAGT